VPRAGGARRARPSSWRSLPHDAARASAAASIHPAEAPGRARHADRSSNDGFVPGAGAGRPVDVRAGRGLGLARRPAGAAMSLPERPHRVRPWAAIRRPPSAS
jgi:hypothetical protein